MMFTLKNIPSSTTNYDEKAFNPMSSYNNIANIKAGNGVKIDQKYNGFQRLFGKGDWDKPTRDRPNERVVTVGTKKFDTATYFANDTRNTFKVTHFQPRDGSQNYLYAVPIDPKTGKATGKAVKQINDKKGHRNFGNTKGFKNITTN
jgi:hypothetical protein